MSKSILKCGSCNRIGIGSRSRRFETKVKKMQEGSNLVERQGEKANQRQVWAVWWEYQVKNVAWIVDLQQWIRHRCRRGGKSIKSVKIRAVIRSYGLIKQKIESNTRKSTVNIIAFLIKH